MEPDNATVSYCVGPSIFQQCAVYEMGGVSSHWLLCVLLARLAIGYCASFFAPLGTIIINGDAHKRNENYLSNILWGSHRGSAAATEVTARCQNLPKRIYPKVNSYAKNPMKTAAEGNNVFKMLNDPPPQRHKLGTIILNGDVQGPEL